MLVFQMNLRNKKKKDLQDSLNLIPMINLIFLLLIFFMLTGVITKKEKILVDYPYSIHGNKKEIDRKDLVFTYLNGTIFYEGQSISDLQLKKLITPEKRIIFNIDKSEKIFEFNKIIKLLKEKQTEKIFIKVIDKK